MANITKRLVDSLEPQGKDYITWDDKIKGFGVKVTPKGRKVYLYKYLSPTKKQRKPALGVHGQITCEQARGLAQEYAYAVSCGEDPYIDKKQSATISINMEELCERYIKEYALIHKKPSSVYNDQSNIKNHILPELGAIPVALITKHEISELHHSLRDRPTLANHVRSLLSKMLNLAEDWGLRPEGSNPVRAVKKYPSKSRERYLTSGEIQRLSEALDMALEQKTETPHVVALFRLLLLTGARVSEIRDAWWEWVDFERKILALPDSKTGKKNIRLSDQAIAILESLPREEDNPFIIVGRNPGEQLKETKKQWKRLCETAGLEGVRIHDLRHTFASKCIEHGISLSVVGELLGHRNAQTTERYAHLVEDHVREATEHVGSKLAGIMG